MVNLVVAILILMAIAGAGIILFAIGAIVCFIVWCVKECFGENILLGVFALLVSIMIIGYMALILISNIVQNFN